MLREPVEQTAVLESRIKAIHVKTNDYCKFYEKRENSLFGMKECWFCRHARFFLDGSDIEQIGLCQYELPDGH